MENERKTGAGGLEKRAALRQAKYLFFDVGSTLVDETEAYNHRIRDAIAGTDVSFEEFEKTRNAFSKQNKKGDLAALEYYGLKKTPWHKEDERLYPQTRKLLAYLKKRGFRLGVIANQSFGTAERLANWGILQYFDWILASAEEGVAKPEPELFRRALARACCAPSEALMIGDRLDNDISPAKKLGMRTIWVKQGGSRFQRPRCVEETPDITVDNLEQLYQIYREMEF